MRFFAWLKEQSIRFRWRYVFPSLIFANFSPQCIFNEVAIGYYYSPGGSSSVVEDVRSTECSLVKTVVICKIKHLQNVVKTF